MNIVAQYPLSRRSALVRLAAGGLGLTLAAHDFPAVGQASTPGVSPAAVPNLIQRWAEAWTSNDPAALAALYTDDGIYVDTPTGIQADPETFARDTMSQISDIQVTLHSGFRGDDHGAAEWDFAFRYTGQFPGLPVGSGQPITWHGATIFEFAGDKIRHSTDYYDNTPFLAALGLLPASKPAATPIG